MTRTPLRPGPHGTRLPLRITLVALIVALVGLALTATGIVATHVLQGYLAGQQEDELREVLDDYGRDPTVVDACRTGVDLALPGPYLVACKAAGSDDLTVVYVPPPKADELPDGDERTEVGRLSLALNGMLARIEWSFRAQQESEEQARASETRMRRFVADASHELRTPLTSIRGFAELYRQGAVGGPEETARLMQRIESEGARMGGLVEDLLQLARLDQQRPLTITPVDLAEVAGDAVHDARAVQPDRPISLQLDPSLSELPVVLGDEARLRQVVGNLVTNALVHTPQTAPVTVTVSDEPAAGDGTADADDGGVVVLRVADGGPGMAPEDAARVFERFYRADKSQARTAGGTGLGLAIVKHVATNHGGEVSVWSREGSGSTFTLRLPSSAGAAPTTYGGESA